MIHHIIKEKDQTELCPYCGISLLSKEWNSEFHLNFHYKIFHCECGKKIRRKVNFIGSAELTSKAESIDGIVRQIKPFEIIKTR